MDSTPRPQRPVTQLKTLQVTHAHEWRAWLAAHHDQETEIWLVFWKKHTGRPCVSYEDALDEALCFGWVDSLVRRLDDNRYARKFTPRKPKSNWSAINRRLFARLVRDGRMTAAGLTKGPPPDTADAEAAADAGARNPAEVPAYIESALRAHGGAWLTFSKLAPSHRRNYVRWIEDAKREETRLRRLAEAIEKLARGEKPGMK
jgi:uncharacterized protein YdeI (YjbR/CyaY-like superfamily)